jgi:hypothetical protein
VREGLRSLLDTLSHQPGVVGLPPAPVLRRGDDRDRQPRPSIEDDDYQLRPPPSDPRAAKPVPVKARTTASRGKAARVASKPARRPKAKPTPRRKRANA